MNYQKRLTYPAARRGDIVDNYHGTPVPDPYRWMEDSTSPDTAAWVEAQNRLTETYLQEYPDRKIVQKRLTALWDYPKYSVPTRIGTREFFTKNDGLQNQSVLYTRDCTGGEPRVLLDPNQLSEDGTIALSSVDYSYDGSLAAYGLSSSGSDRKDIHIRNVETGEDYAEVLQWCKFAGIAWKHDNSGFFYNRYPTPGTVPPEDTSHFNRLYWHTLGTPQSHDRLIYERPDRKTLNFHPIITDDGRYLILHVGEGTERENRIYYREVEREEAFVHLLDDADAMYSFIYNQGPVFYFHTDWEAPRGRIIAIDFRRPERDNWKEIVPQNADTIDDVQVINRQFVVRYLRDAYEIASIYNLNGTLSGELPLPAIGAFSGLTGRPEHTSLYYGFTSFLYPNTIFQYDMKTGETRQVFETGIDFDSSRYETKQVFVTSRDGTKVPMFLTHQKGIQLNGKNPTLLYGYGGFAISLTPYFSISNLIWLENGGIYAVADLRGGGEYGEAWHKAGMLEKKQNVFDDFIAAAEWLIENHYTSPKHLAIKGGSNGGLLVAACLLQRPDLYGAAVCQVPVTDMLRYPKFTAGRFWTSEYGNAEENPDHFKFLIAYSPLHNVKDGIEYPATLITTADTDDRVVPMHAMKFAAALQHAQAGNNPILLRIETKAGHGAGKPTAKIIDEQADIFAFLFRTLKARQASTPDDEQQ